MPGIDKGQPFAAGIDMSAEKLSIRVLRGRLPEHSVQIGEKIRQFHAASPQRPQTRLESGHQYATWTPLRSHVTDRGKQARRVGSGELEEIAAQPARWFTVPRALDS